MAIWYILWSFGIFRPVLVFCTKNNLATLRDTDESIVARFVCIQYTKMWQIQQMTINFNKWPLHKANYHNEYQMGLNERYHIEDLPKYTKICWYENMPSGNPGG
jgi:hypothetical protein